MTIEDAIADFLKEHGHDEWAGRVLRGKWIDVKDGLPDTGQLVQVCRNGRIFQCHYIPFWEGEGKESGRWMKDTADWIDLSDGITHWRSMPGFPDGVKRPGMRQEIQSGDPITPEMINRVDSTIQSMLLSHAQFVEDRQYLFGGVLNQISRIDPEATHDDQ